MLIFFLGHVAVTGAGQLGTTCIMAATIIIISLIILNSSWDVDGLVLQFKHDRFHRVSSVVPDCRVDVVAAFV